MDKHAKRRFVQNAPLATLKAQIAPQRLERLMYAASHRQRGLSLFLENVWNPHNLAAVMRTADALGVQQVHYSAPQAHEMHIAGKETARTAHKWVDVHAYTASEEALAGFKADGWQLVATIADTSAQSLYATDWTQYPKLMLLLGNEHEGLSTTAQQAADIHITIPMVGMVTSLNISVSAALMLAEVIRQRDASAQDFRLSPADADALLEKFLRRALFKTRDVESD